MSGAESIAQRTRQEGSAETATVVLKGELHTDPADLDNAAQLIEGGIDTLVLERAEQFGTVGFGKTWFVLSVGLLAWILDCLYVSKSRLVDLARHHDAAVVSTRASNNQPFAELPATIQLVTAVGFYTLVPASIWIGFATENQHIGSLLLFVGLVAPVVGVRAFNSTRVDGLNRERQIAEIITQEAEPGDRVLAVIGAGHLDGVMRHLPGEMTVERHPPVHGSWSPMYLPRLLPGTLKAGFVLISLYVSVVWLVSVGVELLSPVVVELLAVV